MGVVWVDIEVCISGLVVPEQMTIHFAPEHSTAFQVW